MQKRNEYKPKSVAQPVMGPDTAVILDAQARERAYQASLPMARKLVATHHDRDKIEYHKTEHGNIILGGK